MSFQNAETSYVPEVASLPPLTRLLEEGEDMSWHMPETDLWDAVLMQYLKEVQHIYNDRKRCQKALNSASSAAIHKRKAFDELCDIIHKEKSIAYYITSNDFQVVCDHANMNSACIAKNVRDVLSGKISITDKQVKRNFTRKPDARKGERDDPQKKAGTNDF